FRDSDDRVAVLASAEDGYYTVGADVNGLPDNMWHAVPGLGVELDKPVIAATSGWVVGGGFVLVQMADLCVASETTRFIYPEARSSGNDRHHQSRRKARKLRSALVAKNGGAVQRPRRHGREGQGRIQLALASRHGRLLPRPQGRTGHPAPRQNGPPESRRDVH